MLRVTFMGVCTQWTDTECWKYIIWKYFLLPNIKTNVIFFLKGNNLYDSLYSLAFKWKVYNVPMRYSLGFNKVC